MHGDLVNAICYTAFCPVYAYLWSQEPCLEPNNLCAAARNVNYSFVWTMVFSWISYCKRSVFASILAITGMTVSIAFMNLYGWPHAGQVVVEPQFLWSLMIISGNGHVLFGPKLLLGIIALAGATIVAVFSPLVELTAVLPTLLGAFVIYCVFHYLLTKDPQKIISAYGASILLAGSFSFHVTSEMTKIVTVQGYGKSGGYSILVAGFFAIVGFFSSMAFQQEIHLNSRLEAAVKERTKEVEQQAKQLVIVEHALQASDAGICVLDSDYSILWSNSALKDMLKLEKNLGAGWMFDTFKLSNGIPIDQSTNKTREVKLGDKFFSMEMSECPGTPVTEEKLVGDVKRYLLVMKDITAIRAAEAAERAAEQEAAQAKAMEEAMQNLSHELRTPLQGIMGMTSLLLSNEQASNKEIMESMTMVMTSSRLLLTLINNMLDVQKLNANMLGEFSLSSCSVSTLLKAAVDFCLPLATVHEMTIDVGHDIKEYDMFVQTNKLRLQQVLINLLSNAIKYSPTYGSISVNARRQGVHDVRRLMADALASSIEPPAWQSSGYPPREFVVISVADQGNGIPEEKAGQLFRRFASNWSTCPRVLDDDTKEEPFGTGLGLNLCKRFVERMNGVIWVQNHGGGANFSFALEAGQHPSLAGTSPLGGKKLSRTQANPAVAPSPPSNVPEPADISRWRKKRFLVVDDVRMNLKVAQRMLASIGIKQVDTALSGKEALDLLHQTHSSSRVNGGIQYSVVISDLQMPHMSGLELSRAIHSGQFQDIPIVVGFTADTSPEVAESCISSGMREVLHKPMTKDDLQGLLVRLSASQKAS